MTLFYRVLLSAALKLSAKQAINLTLTSKPNIPKLNGEKSLVQDINLFMIILV